MKINRLEITGFGPYRGTQVVDFDTYADDGIFLITGKTGAGKSSILDAIAFALYDSVPRYDGTKGRLRSDHCAPDDPTSVSLEFTIGRERYRVTRSPEYDRPKARGTGMTTQKPTAQLDALDGGSWRGIAARPVDVAHELADLVGLTKDQFLQVILLAQNRFQKFLLAGSGERETVLRSLFGTSRFADYEEAVTQRRRDLEARLATARAHTEQLLADAAHALDAEPPEQDVTAWLEQQVLALGGRLAQTITAASAADARQRAAEAAHTEALELTRRQTRRAAAEENARDLAAIDDEIESKRAELQLAEQAERAWPYVTGARAAREEHAAAVTAVDRAREAYAAVRTDDLAAPDADTSDLDDAVTALAGRLALLDDVLEQENALPGLASAEADAAHRRTVAAEALDALTQRLAQLPEEIAAVAAELTTATVQAAGVDAARGELERFQAARAAAEQALAVTDELAAARATEAERVRENTNASLALQQLLDDRLAGHAAELAAELVDGEPCAVCGATQHPSPARREQEPVTEADIEAARETLARCETAKADAAREVSRLETRAAELRAATGDRDAAQLDAELEPARDALDRATAAAERVTELEARHAALVDERERGDADRDRLRSERDAHAGAESNARTEITRITSNVEAQRGEHLTITHAVAALTAARDAAQRLAEALRTRALRGDAVAEAERRLADALAEHGFANADAAVTARRAAADRETLRSSIRRHDDARATNAAILAEPELADLPAEAPDIAATAAALETAREARDAAHRDRDTLHERHTALVRTVTTISEKLAASAHVNREFETLQQLANTLAGKDPNTRRMRLESYVLAAELEQIVDAANARLRTMSGGRYTLEHDDAVQYRNVRSGLGLAIFDQHTGQARATHSLSGGETFLASLALALGLAEVVTARSGGITLDTLFIDEGFGSLDADTLEIAMATLDSLRAGGRTVGLISHVEGMKEQIPAKLRISVTDGGWSEISQDAA
ncbi:exonuclease SbcC [Paramicrobacterium humi]|uniref:Nuclease SbcCD subunit C n=1 Tax=Paramicrobacterium humi TaxID=640635 RepID=A0A1H4L9G2_9MICO|nr:SMC family ATPase [Microbacterium humi]SEB67410.1 exonuclease SbcC [Microbacterium humi]